MNAVLGLAFSVLGCQVSEVLDVIGALTSSASADIELEGGSSSLGCLNSYFIDIRLGLVNGIDRLGKRIKVKEVTSHIGNATHLLLLMRLECNSPCSLQKYRRRQQ